jgi:dephospho-CoA kinase
MVRVGLTGGIGSGKSEVSRRLAARGAVVIDADVLAREVVAPGTEGFAAVVAAFGDAVVGPDGALDRPALGRLVFADLEARRRLEAIIHPRVRARAAEIEAAAPPGAIVVHDIPLLVETGQAGRFDLVLVVDVPPEVQLDRLVQQRGMSPEEAQARIASQAVREDRLAAADVVVDNSGTLAELDDRLDEIWPRLRREEVTKE